MNADQLNALPRVTIADITPEWIAATAEAAQRNGHALRPGYGNRIEVQSITHPDEWHPRALSANSAAVAFTNPEDRDSVLATLRRAIARLDAESPAPPLIRTCSIENSDGESCT